MVIDMLVVTSTKAAWRPQSIPPPPAPRGPRVPDDLPERWDEEDDDGTE